MAKKKRSVKGLWSKAEVTTLRKLFSNHPTAKIAARLGRPTEAVKKKASRMGLRKSKKYMKSLGRA
jgi:transcriptional regulator of aromatic amino acid metabolism